jgi:Spy/CpxP family protein refolding chaperone
MTHRFFLAVTLASLAIGLSVVAADTDTVTASPPSASPPPLAPPRPRPYPDRPAVQATVRLFAVLTPEQRESFQKAMEARSQEARSLEQGLQAAREALFRSGIGEKIDADAIQKRAGELAQIEAQLTILRAQVLAKMEPALSPEQLVRLTNSLAAGIPPMRRGLQDMIRDEQGRPLKQPDTKKE